MGLSPSRLELVAVDDGYDYTKALSRTRAATIPTAYSLTPTPKVSVLGRGESLENVYEIEGLNYAIGPDVVSRDTRFEEFPYHPANLAVAMDAIRRVVEPGAAVHVIAGVPLNRFFLPSGVVRDEVSARKAEAWGRPVRAADGVCLPRIRKVTVISEAVAAWVDFVIDEEFVANEDLLNEFMAVVDFGSRTTNLAVFQDGSIDMTLSGTIDRGLLDVQTCIANVLASAYPGTKFPRQFLSEVMRSSKAMFARGVLDMSAEIRAARRALVADVEIFMQSRFGDQLPLMKRLLFVGGGAQVLHPELREHFPNAHFASDPQMANARGMLKYAIAVMRADQGLAAVDV